MKTLNAISFMIILTLLGCRQSVDNVYQKSQEDPLNKIVDTLGKASNPDTSYQYIYDFMKLVIADQKLDLSYGLIMEPEQGCDLSQDDKTFLKILLIKKQKKDTNTNDWRNITITLNELPKCLTQADIEEMLFQKDKLSKLTWDNTQLGFNESNKKNWYSFSVPLFSKDRNKAVMMIRDLCSGLCGTGWTVVFTNENGKWTSKTGAKWIH